MCNASHTDCRDTLGGGLEHQEQVVQEQTKWQIKSKMYTIINTYNHFRASSGVTAIRILLFIYIFSIIMRPTRAEQKEIKILHLI